MSLNIYKNNSDEAFVKFRGRVCVFTSKGSFESGVRKLPFINKKSGRVELLQETSVAEEVRDRNVADKPLK